MKKGDSFPTKYVGTQDVGFSTLGESHSAYHISEGLVYHNARATPVSGCTF